MDKCYKNQNMTFSQHTWLKLGCQAKVEERLCTLRRSLKLQLNLKVVADFSQEKNKKTNKCLVPYTPHQHAHNHLALFSVSMVMVSVFMVIGSI